MEEPHLPGLSARFFGYPRIEWNGAPVRIGRHKAVALLAYLSVTGQRHGRDALAALLWPDYEGTQANAYLRQALWELRKGLGEGILEVDREAAGLAPGSGLWVDVARFEALLAQAAAGTADRLALLDEAAALYRGDFLAGFSLRDSSDFDEWQSMQSGVLRRRLAEALGALAEGQAARGEHEKALAQAQRWLALDPLDEAPHRVLMRLYCALGQRGPALRQYEACVRLLRDELGASPEPATTALYEQIRSAKIGRPPTPAWREPRPPAPSPRQGDLPGDVTPFVGREEELAEIARLLANPECRLLTLVGPGGIGKTRLAVEAARAGAAAFADGAVFVPLAAQDADEGVVAAIDEQLQPALRLEGRAQASLAGARRRLLEHLSGRELLLVLDSVEHLAAAVAGLASEALGAAPLLKVLVTSRERLNLREEWALEVHGLPYPGPGGAGNPEDYAAVQLFLKLARRARADLLLEPADWLAVAEICQRVEGLPLGIELAAPWVRMLPCPQIAAEIGRNQDFLSSPMRGIAERHRSLRAVFEHSWHLLAEREQEVFSRLSVFEGGFSREAAAEVAGATLADLSSLIDRSLVRRDRSGRYDLHQVLKRYAAEKLALSPEEWRRTQLRHAAHYLEQLAAAGEGLKGGEQQGALALLEGEIENLRLAWQRALAAGDWERVRRAMLAWFLFLEMGPRKWEGMEAVHAALAALRGAVARSGADPVLSALLAFVLAVQRYFAMQLEPHVAPGPLIEESLALARGLPPCPEKALVYLLNSVGQAPGSATEAQALARESRSLFEALGDRWGTAMAQLVWADVATFFAGDLAAARPAYEAARGTFQALGNRWGEALCLVGLTETAHRQSRFREAIALGGESLAVYRELGNPWRIVETLGLLAHAATGAGEHTAASEYVEEMLSLLGEGGQCAQLATILVGLADAARRQGGLVAARGYLERALALYQETGDRPGTASAEQRLRELEEVAASPSTGLAAGPERGDGRRRPPRRGAGGGESGACGRAGHGTG